MRRGDWRKILGAAALIALLTCPPAWANGNEATDLVAPYGHFPWAAGAATGPFTTHYLVSSTTGVVGTTVNVKCFNETIEPVGPVGGTTITLAPFEMEVWSPVSLGLTPHVDFTGFGFCYFAVTGGDDIAVTFIAGISEGNNLITTNNSLAIMSDTAQSDVLDGIGIADANIPYWTNEGSWQTYLLFLDPTATGTDLTMDVYNPAGILLGTWSAGGTPDLAPRDLDFTSMIDAVPATAGAWGHADIATPDRGFMGWVAGVNLVSFQAFIYPIPLDKDDISTPLGVGDRP